MDCLTNIKSYNENSFLFYIKYATFNVLKMFLKMILSFVCFVNAIKN